MIDHKQQLDVRFDLVNQIPSISYKSLSEPVLVNSSYELRFPPTSATSENYQDNSYKMWRFIAPAGSGLNVKIGYFDTEFNEDFLYLGTGTTHI